MYKKNKFSTDTIKNYILSMTIVRSGNEYLCDVKTFQNYFFLYKNTQY